MKTTLLALDISTKTIGISISEIEGENIKLLEVTHVRPKIPGKVKGTEALFMKSKIFSNDITRKCKGYSIDSCIIEEPLIGSNNAYTVGTLLRYNGMISQLIFDKMGVISEYISSHDARMYAFPELMAVRRFNKKGEPYSGQKIRHSLKNGELVLFGDYPFDCDKKVILQQKVSEMFPGINWIYKKDNVTLREENYDASDSIVCALGYMRRKIYDGTEAKITEWSEDKENRMFAYKVDFCGKEHEIKVNAPDL